MHDVINSFHHFRFLVLDVWKHVFNFHFVYYYVRFLATKNRRFNNVSHSKVVWFQYFLAFFEDHFEYHYFFKSSYFHYILARCQRDVNVRISCQCHHFFCVYLLYSFHLLNFSYLYHQLHFSIKFSFRKRADDEREERWMRDFKIICCNFCLNVIFRRVARLVNCFF